MYLANNDFFIFSATTLSKEDATIRRIAYLQYQLGKEMSRSIEIKQEQAKLMREQQTIQEKIGRITAELKVLK